MHAYTYITHTYNNNDKFKEKNVYLGICNKYLEGEPLGTIYNSYKLKYSHNYVLKTGIVYILLKTNEMWEVLKSMTVYDNIAYLLFKS